MEASGYRFPAQGGGPGGAGGGQRVRVEGFPFDMGGGDIGDLGDLFSVFTGGRGRRQERVTGADLEADVRISFDEAMQGVTVPLRIQGPAPCPTCRGSGAEPGTSPETCP